MCSVPGPLPAEGSRGGQSYHLTNRISCVQRADRDSDYQKASGRLQWKLDQPSKQHHEHWGKGAAYPLGEILRDPSQAQDQERLKTGDQPLKLPEAESRVPRPNYSQEADASNRRIPSQSLSQIFWLQKEAPWRSITPITNWLNLKGRQLWRGLRARGRILLLRRRSQR